MPNLNVKGESSRPSAGESASGGGGIPKVVLIVVIAIVAIGGLVFVLNTTGVVKLWGKKKPAPVVVNIPTQVPAPVAKDTMKAEASKTKKNVDANAAMQKSISKLESNASANGKMVMGVGNYTIQLASWLSQEKAAAQADVFSNAGFEAFVEHRGGYFTVNVGHFESRKKAKVKADSMAHMLESMYVIAKVGN